ncbi:MAG: PadR family transcriptional regulator [Atribacterota bacterium]
MDGLVSSTWDTEGPGPTRRVYTIAEPGRTFLRDWSRKVRESLKLFEKLIQAVEEGGH